MIHLTTESTSEKLDAVIEFAAKENFPKELQKESFLVESRYQENGSHHRIQILGNDYLTIGGDVAHFLLSKKVNGAQISLASVSTENQKNLILGLRLGGYRFDRHQSTPSHACTVLVNSADQMALLEAQSFADGTYLARDFKNEEPNTLYPESYANQLVEHFSGTNVEVTILSQDNYPAFDQEFAGLSAVGRGSYRSPRFVVLRYAADATQKLIGLVGKGITFDTGGISLKISRNISDMKMDMGGSAAVVGAFDTLVKLGAAANVIGVLVLAENRPGRDCFLPGEIIRYANGKTVEVGNTDAEGRLALADALIYAEKQGAKEILEASTLTGACVAALGTAMSGIFGNEELAAKIQQAGSTVGEKHWLLPMEETYRDLLKGSVSDLVNITNKNWAGAITAALFLDEFVEKVPFLHMDIAGPMDSDKNKGILTVGATGFGARSFAKYVLNEVK